MHNWKCPVRVYAACFQFNALLLRCLQPPIAHGTKGKGVLSSAQFPIRKICHDNHTLQEERLFPLIRRHLLPFCCAPRCRLQIKHRHAAMHLSLCRVSSQPSCPPRAAHQKELSAAQGRKQSNIDFLPYLSTRCRKEIYKRDVLPLCVSSEPLSSNVYSLASGNGRLHLLFTGRVGAQKGSGKPKAPAVENPKHQQNKSFLEASRRAPGRRRGRYNYY